MAVAMDPKHEAYKQTEAIIGVTVPLLAYISYRKVCKKEHGQWIATNSFA